MLPITETSDNNLMTNLKIFCNLPPGGPWPSITEHRKSQQSLTKTKVFVKTRRYIFYKSMNNVESLKRIQCST